jgi:hypothetical protein
MFKKSKNISRIKNKRHDEFTMNERLHFEFDGRTGQGQHGLLVLVILSLEQEDDQEDGRVGEEAVVEEGSSVVYDEGFGLS